MKKNIEDLLFNECIKYLGKYPATKNKLIEIINKKIRNKKLHIENNDREILLEKIITRLDDLNIINESNYLESMFNYYQKSLFSIRKIKNKLHQKGFDKKKIDEHISIQLQENSELETDILKEYIKKKKLEDLELNELKKKLYNQGFLEGTIYKIIRE